MIEQSVLVCLGILLLTSVILLIRFLKGPSALDRALVLEIMTLTILSALILVSIYYSNNYLLDLAPVISFIPFLGSVALARLINWRNK